MQQRATHVPRFNWRRHPKYDHNFPVYIPGSLIAITGFDRTGCRIEQILRSADDSMMTVGHYLLTPGRSYRS